jgi:hypothetical protein
MDVSTRAAAAIALFTLGSLAMGNSSGQASPHAPAMRGRPERVRQWSVIGEAPLSAGEVLSPYLELSPSGVPHIAYQDFLTTNHRLSLRRWSESLRSWLDVVPQGAGSAQESWYNRFVFAPDGTLWLAAREYGQPTAAVRTLSPFNGVWSLLPSGASPGEAHCVDLALQANGWPIVVVQDRTTTPIDRTTVRRFDGTQWHTMGTPGISAGLAHYQSLSMGPTGQLVCAWSDLTAGGRPVVKQWNESLQTWLDCGAPNFSLDNAANLVVEHAPDGSVWLAWVVTNQRVSVWKLEGQQWLRLGGDVDAADTPVVATENWRQWLCLRFDSSGRPWTAYQAANEGRKAVVKRFENGAWQAVGGPYFTSAAADYLTMTMGADDTPWVAYRDGTTRKAVVMAWR